jgi:hypothetical protein
MSRRHPSDARRSLADALAMIHVEVQRVRSARASRGAQNWARDAGISRLSSLVRAVQSGG